QFQDILNNETLLKELRQKAHMHEEEQKPTRCPVQQVTTENSKSVKVFKKVMDDGTPNVEYLHSFQMATPLTRIAGCLLMNRTFLPSGQLLKVWECLHVLVSVATAIVLPIQGAFFYKSILGWVITYTLDVLSWIAMYIGLHTAYYNKKGCLVSHPLATAKHYFTTNFLLDLSAVLPLEAIPFCLGYQDLNYLVFLRLNRMINIYHLSLAFSHLEQDIRREVGIIRTMKFILYIIIFMNWLTCGLFMISCPPEILGIATKDTLTTGHHCIEGSWVLRTLTANESSIWTLYLTSLYWATATSVSVGYGDIAAETDLEVAAAVVISIVGVVFFGYVIASVFAGLVNADAQRAKFQEKLCAVQTFMKDQEVSAGLQRRIINHYEYVWTRSHGVDPRSLFDGLPLSLWGDVTYSLYKDMIVKVPVALFENADVGFVKMLSRSIKPVLFLKGEYVVRKHDIGSEMFFIHHGAVDVVSEDGDTVFDTMNAGRFFGEISLLFSCPRTASIRAHTNCHLFVLSKADLDEVLIYYPDINQQVMITAEKRRIKAKQRSALQLRTEHVEESITSAGISGVRDNQEGKRTAFGPHSDFAEIEFKATKTQKVTVGKVTYCRKTSGQGSAPRREAPHPENTALHKNTDSDSSQEAVAGTSQATVDVNSIEIVYNSEPACRENVSSNHVTTPERNVSGCAWCWTSWNDFTINPHGHFGTVFSWLTLFCTVLSWWTILFEACYQDHELALFAVNILIDAFFWLEIYIKSHLSFHDETGHLIDAAVIVRQSYVRRPSGLLLDAIAACPIEVVVLALPREQWVSMWSYLRLLHVLRLVKVHQFFAAWEKELNVSMLTVRLWKSMIVLFVTLHICSCLWYVVACPGGVCGPNTWAHLAGFQDHTVSSIERYCNCVYWCVATVTSTGYGDISAHTNIEMVVSIVVMLIGKILFGYILGTIASSQANAARTTVAYREKVAVIKDELADLNVPPHLKDQVVNYYHYQWQRKKGVDLRSLMVDCPYTLQSELALQICQPMFTGEKQLSLFKDIPDALKRELALKVQLKFFVPDVQVVQKGDVNSSAFYILKGEIALEGDQLDSLGSGSVIGEVNLILDDPKPAVVTYVAKSHVDILVLAKSDLDTVLGHFPAVRNTMEHIAEQKFRLPRNSDHRRPSSAVFLKVPSKTWEMHL
ncbi:potassium voltage-gated channel subfamily H member 6, partial [Lingula anatina]|uniref:Potassium voltage-gated channel subfamily H member 6 n=1 Tax=Lingula anatina TaxID=7574 RepID=A0A1S3HTM8_LINAN